MAIFESLQGLESNQALNVTYGSSPADGNHDMVKGIEKTVSKFVCDETKKVTSTVSLLQDNLKEIRDYAKEELEKVRREMQQFAKVLDNRFGSSETMANGSGFNNAERKSQASMKS